ncbi:MAG TPA: DUF4838 domain-containing protein [Chitinophagales bacterium]|nr:DUF4838 domain-containing protein [Chitinophagales bacterium]
MYFKKLFFFLTISFIFSSCVIIQESRNKKKLAEVEYVKVYEENKDTFETSKKVVVVKDNNATHLIEDADKIWYHPNPWWRISSKPFPSNKDSFKYIKNAPQYGFSNYVNPLTNTTDKYTWSDWKIMNHQQYDDGGIIHIWSGFINLYKNEFSKHPEYLAEIGGKRLGYGKTSKLCVTNKNMQNIFVDYTIKRIKDNPQFKFFSIEPSDGAGFCTCVNCSKLGSISNQVFYFANQIAKEIKKTHPDKTLGLLAYNKHSEPPTFKIEDNVKVVVAPKGFQTIFSPMGMMLSWIETHHNLGEREYFAIPQWTGDQPAIVIQDYINRIKFANSNGVDMIIFESATNLNATLLMTMLGQFMMNPSLSWEEIYNKFLDNCFNKSKIPIQRLFNRWHSKGNFNLTDAHYALYDLNEASQLAKSSEELQRIRDLKAYIHYLVLYLEWSKNRNDIAKTKIYFDYLYNSSNRNIVNVNALTRIFAKHFNTDKALNSKYTYRNTQDKNWIKYITDQEIEANFQKDLKSYPPIIKENISNQTINKIAKKTSPQEFLEAYESPIKARNSIDLYSNNTSISITPTYTQKDTKTMISIYAKEGVFIQQKLMNNNETWTIQLPESGVYTIMQNRIPTVNIQLKGKLAPILSDVPKTNNSQHKIRTINKKLELEPLDRAQPIDQTNSIYIITKPLN